MIIKYKLMTATHKGIKESTDTAILDIDSQIELSFYLSSGKELGAEVIAVFVGQDSKEHKTRIVGGKCELPKQLIKPQLIMLTVIEIKDGKILHRWVCQAFKIINLSEVGKYLFQVVEDYPTLPQDVRELQTLCNSLVERLDKLEAENLWLRQQLEQKQEDIRANISKDVQGLIDYKKLNNEAIEKIMNAINETNKTIVALKEELSL